MEMDWTIIAVTCVVCFTAAFIAAMCVGVYRSQLKMGDEYLKRKDKARGMN